MPADTVEPRPSERAAPPRDFAGFLIELAIALQNHGVYPPGHPFLARSAEAVVRRLDELLSDRGAISFGVARQQLVIEGVATEPSNPVLGGLAGRLHRHRVGAVTLARGLDADEAADVLRALAADAEQAGPLLRHGGEAVGWPHVHLHPVTFGALEMVDEGDADADAARAPALWIGLARAALASDDESAPAEPAAVARAIDEHARAAAYDQVIVGYLLQLADELRGEGERGADGVRRRLARMIAGLRPETLRRLMEMGGDAAQRRRFLLDAGHGFAADAVVRLVEAAAAASGQTVSHSLLRILSKLAAHAGGEAGPAGASADAALREQVAALVADWSLPDPNPGAYTATLERLAAPPASPASAASSAYDADPERIVQMALEVDAAGPAAWDAMRRMIRDGRLAALVDLLAGAPAGSALAAAAWDRAATSGSARRLLRGGPDAARALDLVLARLGKPAAIPALLDELVESDVRVVRRAALTRLAALPAADVAREAARRLDDPRWYVARNLLSLLHDVGTWPDDFSPAPFLRHADARVRREALKLALRIPDERERAVATALADPDEQAQRIGLGECLAGIPAPVLPLVCRRADDPAADPELRLLAIRVLGHATAAPALRTLLKLTDGGRTLLGRRRLAPVSSEMLAALAALTAGWRAHPDAAPVLEAAAKSADPRVRAALSRREGA